MGKKLHASIVTSLLLTAASASAAEGVVTDYSNGEAVERRESSPDAAGTRKDDGSGGPTRGNTWQSNGWYLQKDSGRGPIWYKPVCEVAYRDRMGNAKTYAMRMDVNESSPPDNGQLRCYIEQEKQIQIFCNNLKRDPKSHANFERIMQSGYMMNDYVTMVPSATWTVARNSFAYPPGVTDETIYRDYLKGYSFPEKGRDLYNARFALLRMETRVGVDSSSGSCSSKLPDGKYLRCGCAEATGMLRLVEMLANSAIVRRGLDPNAKVTEVIPKHANRYFGSAEAPPVEKPVLGHGN